jgi:membrane protease YdiL (CAAX protease family)
LDLQFLFYFLLSFLAVGAGGLYLSGKNKKLATNSLLILGTIFVAYAQGKAIFVENRLGKNSSSSEADRAEMMLRVNSSVEHATSGFGPNPLHRALNSQPDVYGEAEKLLRSAADGDKSSTSIWAKLVITEHASKHKYQQDLTHLVAISGEQGKCIGPSLATLYPKSPNDSHLSLERAKELSTCLEKELSSGWYRDSALLELYRITGQKAQLDALNQSLDQKGVTLISKLLGLVVFGAIATLAGLIAIFVQLLFISRRITNPEDKALVQAPAAYGVKPVYAVFLAWQCTQLLIGMMVGSAFKSGSAASAMLKTAAAGANGVLLTACVMALFYVLSNGPSLVYAYFFALRPNAVSYLEGTKLRAHVGRTGPAKLVLIGVLTWFAAIPIVIIAALISAKIGSQGSSNPVLGLAMEAARSPNPSAIIVFYLTLGVLAPFCEESLFRGFLYSSLRRAMPVIPAMLISAVLFAGCHFDAGGFVPLFTLGCIFAFIFERTKSIIPSMVAHGLWNSGTFTIMLLLFGN